MEKYIYLDYSATTKPDKRVLDCFNDIAANNWANPNSNYYIAKNAYNIIEESTNNILEYFNTNNHDLIFTSGASEANNLAIKGIAELNNKKKIITTELEHHSGIGPLGYLQKQGYEIQFVKLTEEGIVDLDNLKSLLCDDTLLVSVVAIDSEIGIRQPIEEIGLLLKDKDIYFHSDITQAVGKTSIDLTNIDFASFSGHKIYSIKGIGGLLKKKDIKIQPLINGGKSTTVYRSGTPATELVGSMSEGFNLFINSLDDKYAYVKKLNNNLKEQLKDIPNVYINSTILSIPHILNISIINHNSNDTQKYFADNNIFISTKTACASNTDMSKSVLALTNEEERAKSSVRISLSYKTTEEEINTFVSVLKTYIKEQ